MTPESKRRLLIAKTNMDRSREQYREAVMAAHEAGIPHTEIARVVGVSEAAIRRFVKRNQERLT